MSTQESIVPAATRAASKRSAGRWLLGGGALVVVLGAFAYANRHATAPPAPEPRSGAAPVRVATALQRDTPVVEHTIGTVVANTTVQVTSRVQGVIESAQFREGQLVHDGDLLFRIDPRPYKAALEQARAQLAKDEAQLQNAQNNEKRIRSIYAQHLTSAEDLDSAIATTGSAIATVASDHAAIDLAQLNLDYTEIRSTVDGKTGAILVQPGNMVAANGTAPLVIITQVRPVKVSFALPQSDLPRIQARARAGGLTASVDERGEGGEGYSAPVDFIGNRVDDTSGTIELRATFPNEDASLVPGQLVDVTVGLDEIPGATVVPHEAVNTGPDGLFTYVVTKDSHADQRTVRVLFDDGVNAAIAGNVHAGDEVIVDGQLRVVPGAAVLVDRPKPQAAARGSAGGNGGRDGS